MGTLYDSPSEFPLVPGCPVCGDAHRAQPIETDVDGRRKYLPGVIACPRMTEFFPQVDE